jgi:hypothetical protein
MDTVSAPLPVLWHDAPTFVVADQFQHLTGEITGTIIR